MRVLVTGAGGLLGGRLAALLAESFDVIAAWRRSAPPEGIPRVAAELDSYSELAAALESSRPDAVVHSAALADADRCEADPALARAANVHVPEALAALCQEKGLRLVALSTDLVFDGEQSWLDESAVPQPLMTYGRTKLAGEEAVLAAYPEAAIGRVALLYGRGHGSRSTASESVAGALRRGAPIRLFTDQYRTPVDAESVAGALAALLRGDQRGRFHLGGPERLSRYELGCRVAEILGLSPATIEPISQGDLALGAARPADVSLRSERAQRELGYEPRSIEEGIRSGR